MPNKTPPAQEQIRFGWGLGPSGQAGSQPRHKSKGANIPAFGEPTETDVRANGLFSPALCSSEPDWPKGGEGEHACAPSVHGPNARSKIVEALHEPQRGRPLTPTLSPSEGQRANKI